LRCIKRRAGSPRPDRSRADPDRRDRALGRVLLI